MAESQVNQELAKGQKTSEEASDKDSWKTAYAREALRESIKTKESLAKDCINEIVIAADLIADALRGGKKVAFFGNGGSAADAQHMSAELVGKFETTRPPLRAIAFTTNSSILTAIGNDYGFDEVFARQVAANINEGDIVVGISTSGRSKNIINGIRQAQKLGAKTIALTGASGEELARMCDHSVVVPSKSTQRIQECHITIGHVLCGLIERSLGTGH